MFGELIFLEHIVEDIQRPILTILYDVSRCPSSIIFWWVPRFGFEGSSGRYVGRYDEHVEQMSGFLGQTCENAFNTSGNDF